MMNSSPELLGAVIWSTVKKKKKKVYIDWTLSSDLSQFALFQISNYFGVYLSLNMSMIIIIPFISPKHITYINHFIYLMCINKIPYKI